MVSSVVTAGTQVAVIDDDEDVREALAASFSSAGVSVASFADAESFLSAWGSRTFACVVSDVQMPGIGGLELARRLGASGASPPVILVSAYANDAMRRRAIAAGVDRFYEKPFDPADLLGRVLELTRRPLRS